MLSVENLTVAFGSNEVVKGISFHLNSGEILGIVGESGSGKSIASLCIMGLLPNNAGVKSGSILFAKDKSNSVDLVKISDEEHRQLRGKDIAMIFQEPHTSLNPSMRCGKQLLEAVELNSGFKGKAAENRCMELLSEMQLPDPLKIYKSYPHQLSGGQKQRVMIAIALAGNPKLLIADEPTTALDVTVQKSILSLLKDIRNRYQMGIIFISHDLSVIEEVADKVIVMKLGEIVESGKAKEVFNSPRHTYTQALINYRKSLNSPNSSFSTDFAKPKIFSVNNLEVLYGKQNKFFKRLSNRFVAVNKVSFDLLEGETLGLVGESGSGKSTIGRSILRLIKKNSGNVLYNGKTIEVFSRNEMLNFRREVQLIFQDPYSSLNPRLTVGQALMEPMLYHGLVNKTEEAKQIVLNLLDKVKLPESSFYRYPHEFSGGQRQRIVIARALTLQPKVLICDEIISALDVAIQSQILELLDELKRDFNLTYLFISHDLGVVRHISDRVIVLQHGNIIELGPVNDIFNRPQSDYTKNLIDSVPGLRD
ncbi:MAG: ABC transporter ATP-binding protein [Bacteroidales bacterium]|nr:MAG: ABC transporter ATP-binding protein [Bacteroidales bacterium]